VAAFYLRSGGGHHWPGLLELLGCGSLSKKVGMRKIMAAIILTLL